MIYQISEREEEEEYHLPLKTPESGFSLSNSTLTSVSNTTQQDIHKELKDTVEISVIEETESADSEINKFTDNKQEQVNIPAHQSLQVPGREQFPKSFYPPISKTNFPSVKHKLPDESISKGEISISKIIDQPKYTHIRVPKIHSRRSQFEISEDSPFYLPKLDNEPKFHLPKLENCHGKFRKPVTVSLSKNIEKAKSISKSRKQWNLKRLDEPVNYFESAKSVGNTDDNSITSEHAKVNDNVVTAERIDDNGSVVERSNIEYSKTNGHCLNNISSRKKWNLPDFWPRQQEGNSLENRNQFNSVVYEQLCLTHCICSFTYLLKTSFEKLLFIYLI